MIAFNSHKSWFLNIRLLCHVPFLLSHSSPRSYLSTRVKKKSFADDQINVIPAAEAEISGHTVGINSIAFT